MDLGSVIFRTWVLVASLLLLGAAEAVAGAWTQPQGRLWLKLGGTIGAADEKFANDQIDQAKLFPDGTPVEAGDKIPFDFATGGDYQYQSYGIEAVYGVLDWLELSGTLPLLHTRFDNDNNEVEPGTGIGDLRFGVGVQLFERGRGVLAVGAEWKAPTADVPRSVYAQPLGEGQHDFTAWLRGGWSLWPLGWAQMSVGHRWRGENTELGFNPGREWHFQGEFGWQLQPTVALKAGVEGLEGQPWTSDLFGFEQEIGTRQLWSITPAILYRLDRLGWERMTLEIGGAFALVGEDLPVGRELRVAWMMDLGE
jgi:hypothetical protein